jgi:hypothetical protein
MMADRPDPLVEQLSGFGLVALGEFLPDEGDRLPEIAPGNPARRVVLAGNASPEFWPVFVSSPENRDGRPDPLDRWSRRVGTACAEDLGGRVVFPFDGPPYPPFLGWAARTGRVHVSPISMAIHADFGLWHAYRFALLLPEPATRNLIPENTLSPCYDCPDQPCLSACPVEAFDAGRYDVNACVDHVRSPVGRACRSAGCVARRACPFQRERVYEPIQASFHMSAFLRSR